MQNKINLHVGIDACNIRHGGGLTHLSQMLNATNLDESNIKKVTVWCSRSTASKLPNKPWLEKRTPFWANSALPFRIIGQQLALVPDLIANGCNVLFSPGGTLPSRCSIPTITMSQNMLPFEPIEAARFGKMSIMRLKMRILRTTQTRSFKQADGLIYLTKYAELTISNAIKKKPGNVAIIPHGIESRFFSPPRSQRESSDFNNENPFRFLYVSVLLPYKHQYEVAQAAYLLRAKGIPLEVNFIGASWKSYGQKFNKLLQVINKTGNFLHWSGSMPFTELHEAYKKADAFIFASSCENLPNILIEAMCAGLPIASSRLGPMPEVLEDAGLYFDPNDSTSIAEALQKLIFDSTLREKLATLAWERSKNYSWELCARDTFQFISDVAINRLKTS